MVNHIHFLAHHSEMNNEPRSTITRLRKKLRKARLEYATDSIRISYGSDRRNNIFLSVRDCRLCHDFSASDNVNQVVSAIGQGDGQGSILDLHTGDSGVGQKVDHETMSVFLRRYGVPTNKIIELMIQRETCNCFGSTETYLVSMTCRVCGKRSMIKCGCCEQAFCFSKACHYAAWHENVHQDIFVSPRGSQQNDLNLHVDRDMVPNQNRTIYREVSRLYTPRRPVQLEPITRAYGSYAESHIYLSVRDSRLMHNSSASDAVNKVVSNLGLGNGSGTFLDLYTGDCGVGRRVDRETMRTFLRRYGVPRVKIVRLLQNLETSKCPVSSPLLSLDKKCFYCGKEAFIECRICTCAFYCNRICRAADWRVHCQFCGIIRPPSSQAADPGVFAVLLHEDGRLPAFVHLPLNAYDESSKYQNRGNPMTYWGSIRSDRFPSEKCRTMNAGYHILYKRDFLVDGISRPNKTVANLLPESSVTHWRGHLLIVKASKERNPTYLDMTIEDIPHSVWFLKEYAAS